VGEGFAGTCTNEEALKLVEDSTMMEEHIVEMLSIGMSKGRICVHVYKQLSYLPPYNIYYHEWNRILSD
jgi:hypothetical protein